MRCQEQELWPSHKQQNMNLTRSLMSDGKPLAVVSDCKCCIILTVVHITNIDFDVMHRQEQELCNPV